jgi:hypothetical protein
LAAVLERGTIRVAYDPLWNEDWALEVDGEGNPSGGFWKEWLEHSAEFISQLYEEELVIEWVPVPSFYQVVALDDGTVDVVFDVAEHGVGKASKRKEF